MMGQSELGVATSDFDSIQNEQLSASVLQDKSIHRKSKGFNFRNNSNTLRTSGLIQNQASQWEMFQKSIRKFMHMH